MDQEKIYPVVKVFYDTETTGTNPKKHCMHNLAGMIEVDGVIVETFDYNLSPHPNAELDPAALKVGNVTPEDLMLYDDFKQVQREFVIMLSKYIDRYDSKSKAYLVGFNNRRFDDEFLRTWFDLCYDTFFGSYFWSDSHDVLVLASVYLQNKRVSMPTFKLKRVALTLGLEVVKSKLHGALYDAQLTYQMYKIVTKCGTD